MNAEYTSFVEKIRPAALSVEAETGIPWRFAMVQAAHESRYGSSLLATEANNLFGITGDSWYASGKPVWWRETTEYGKDGVPFRIRRPFRRYASWEESLADWASLIEKHYPIALAAAKIGDFDGFAHGLQMEGYATDPKYAVQLVKLNKQLEDIA